MRHCRKKHVWTWLCGSYQRRIMGNRGTLLISQRPVSGEKFGIRRGLKSATTYWDYIVRIPTIKWSRFLLDSHCGSKSFYISHDLDVWPWQWKSQATEFWYFSVPVWIWYFVIGIALRPLPKTFCPPLHLHSTRIPFSIKSGVYKSLKKWSDLRQINVTLINSGKKDNK